MTTPKSSNSDGKPAMQSVNDQTTCAASHKPTARPRGRPATLSPEERRTMILDALGCVYDDGGAANLTMDAVAKRVGMSKRTLYGIFEDRAALFEAYLERRVKSFIQDAPHGDRAASLRHRLSQMFKPVPDTASDLPLAILRCVIAEAPDRPDMAKRLRANARGRAEALIRAELDQSVASGEIPPLDTTIAARIFLDMFKDNPLDHLVDPDTIRGVAERQNRLSIALDIFCAGVSHRP